MLHLLLGALLIAGALGFYWVIFPDPVARAKTRRSRILVTLIVVHLASVLALAASIASRGLD